MARLFALLVLILLTCGCSPAGGPFSHQPTSAQALFAKGVDQVARGKPARAFVLLKEKYPDSPWTTRARAVTALNRKIRQQARTLRALRQQKEQCHRENARLSQEVARFQSDLVKLKKLLIENELRHH